MMVWNKKIMALAFVTEMGQHRLSNGRSEPDKSADSRAAVADVLVSSIPTLNFSSY